MRDRAQTRRPPEAPAPGARPATRRPARRRRPFWRRIRWQGLARTGLALGIVGFAIVVVQGVRDREAPVAPRGVDRADPKAIAEIRSGRITQTAGELEDYTLAFGLQQTYDDGSNRFTQGFRLEVAEQPDRDGLVVTGGRASVDPDQARFVVEREASAGEGGAGDPGERVQLAVSDGLGAQTDTATYSRQDGTVTMPGPTTLTRAGMDAFGGDAMVETGRSFATLGAGAHVQLAGDTRRATIDIWSSRAVLAHDDGYMRFDGDTEVTTGSMRLEAEQTTAHFGVDETALERLELRDRARIHTPEPEPGALREMRAQQMTLAFEQTARRLERVTLVGGTSIELMGLDGTTGARIGASVMEVMMSSDGGDIEALEARDGVTLALPDTAAGARQEIRAAALASQGTPDTGLNSVVFTDDVEYEERRAPTATGQAGRRVIRAERLEAGVEPGLTALLTAQFLEDVRFEDGDRTATADDVVYDVAAGLVTLNSVGETGRAPTVTDHGSRIEASTVTLSLDGSAIEASGDVRSELRPNRTQTDEMTESTLPAMLDPAQQTFATAGSLRYDPDTGQTAYSGGARLWQGQTSFAGETLSLDDQTGGLSATGKVTTTIQLVRIHETTGESAVSLTRAQADAFLYNETTREAAYDGKAVLLSDAGDLKADRIAVFLKPDGRTLDRLEATGNVKLRLDGRWATGDLLVYDEAQGRYDMEGAPVQIVEEVAPEDPIMPAPPPRPGTPPPAPACSTMDGRQLTFYRSNDTVTVDGSQVLRTQSKSGQCAPLAF